MLTCGSPTQHIKYFTKVVGRALDTFPSLFAYAKQGTHVCGKRLPLRYSFRCQQAFVLQQEKRNVYATTPDVTSALRVTSRHIGRHGSPWPRAFLPSISGTKWAAVATDCATRDAVTRALPTSCATDVNELLKDITLPSWSFKEAPTEPDRHFLSGVVDDILRSCPTQLKLNTAYHPQTNDLTELKRHAFHVRIHRP